MGHERDTEKSKLLFAGKHDEYKIKCLQKTLSLKKIICQGNFSRPLSTKTLKNKQTLRIDSPLFLSFVKLKITKQS